MKFQKVLLKSHLHKDRLASGKLEVLKVEEELLKWKLLFHKAEKCFSTKSSQKNLDPVTSVKNGFKLIIIIIMNANFNSIATPIPLYLIPATFILSHV